MSENYNDLYTQNENGTEGGYFPIGEGYTWHSGIHLYDENIKPLLDGNIVAYRQASDFKLVPRKKEITKAEHDKMCKEEASLYQLISSDKDPQKNSQNIYELMENLSEEEKKEKASPNFYLIKHSLLENKLNFYTLYNHFYPDELKFKNEANFIKATKDIKKYNLSITKTFKYKFVKNKTDLTPSNILPGQNIYPGSWCKSIYKYAVDDFINLINKLTKKNGSLSCTFETEAGTKLIPANLVEIKTASININNKKVYQPKGNLIYKYNDEDTVIGTYTTNKSIPYSEMNTPLKVEINGKSEGFSKDSSYLNTKVLLPKKEVGTVLSDETTTYSLRDKSNDKIYAVSSNVSSLTKKNCPLEYEIFNISNIQYSRIINNEIIVLTHDEFREIYLNELKENEFLILLSDDDRKIIFNKQILQRNQILELFSTDHYQIQDTINKNYIIPAHSFFDVKAQKNLFNKNEKILNAISTKPFVFVKLPTKLGNTNKETKIFYKGQQITPIYLEPKLQKKWEKVKKQSNNTSFDFSDITVLLTKPINTYKKDAFIHYSNGFSSIEENGGYIFCKRYIQNTKIREFEIKKEDITIDELIGKIKGTPNKDNLMLYNNLLSTDTYNSKNPQIEKTNDFEFTSDNPPTFDGTNYIFNTIDIGDTKKYSAIINKEHLQIKIDNKELTKNKDIKIDGNIHFCKIPVNCSDILGFSCSNKDNANQKKFYDVSLFLENNFMSQKIKGIDKQYYIYKNIEADKVLYENNLSYNKIFFPESTSFLLVNESKLKDKTSYKLNVKEIPVYFNKSDVEIISDSIKYRFKTKPDTCYLDDHRADENRPETLYCYNAIQNIYDKFKDNNLDFIRKDLVNPNSYKAFYFNADDLNLSNEFWILEDTYNLINTKQTNPLLLNTEIDIKINIDKFICYNKNPLLENSQENLLPMQIYIPIQTKLTILENYEFENSKSYKVKFSKIPLTIHNGYIKEVNVKYKIKNTPKTIKLNTTDVTKDSKNELQYFAKNFFDKIDILKLKEYDFYQEKNGKIGLLMPGNLIFTMFDIWCTKEVVENKDNWAEENLKSGDVNKFKQDLTFNFYSKDPLYIYKKEHKVSKETKILKIDDIDILQDTAKQNYFEIELAENKTKLYISETEANKYRTDATEWEKFFTICETDADQNILSNIQDLNKILKLSEEQNKDLEKIIEDVNENNSKNDKKISEIEEIFKKDTDTKKTITNKLRTLNVTHIHELEEKAYDYLKKDKRKKIEQEYLQGRCKEIEIWNKLKSDSGFPNSECKKIECKNDLLTFVNPIYFLNHLEISGISNPHALELYKVQNIIIHLNNLRPHKSKNGGIWGNQAGTFCNHAIFLAIQALDKDYSHFIAGETSIPDTLNKFSFLDSTIIDQYKNGLWISNIWCDILEYQANNHYETGIECINENQAKRLANQGKIVIAAWKNTTIKSSDGKNHPHYVTIAPSIFLPNIKGLPVANVGASCSFNNINNAFDNSKKTKTIKYYYNRNQNHIFDLSKLNQLKAEYDMWEGELWKSYIN